MSIPGPPVSMTAFEDSLLVAYHCGGARKADQCINMKLIRFNGFTIESQDINSALGPDTTLAWIGFTDVGSPAMMDSKGILSLCAKNSLIWMPFCDTHKHVSLEAQ